METGKGRHSRGSGTGLSRSGSVPFPPPLLSLSSQTDHPGLPSPLDRGSHPGVSLEDPRSERERGDEGERGGPAPCCGVWRIRNHVPRHARVRGVCGLGEAQPEREKAMGNAGDATKASWKEEDEEWTVDCPCGVQTDDGHPMIECEVCNVWAHIHCIGHGEDVEHYVCASCRKTTARNGTNAKVRNRKRTRAPRKDNAKAKTNRANPRRIPSEAQKRVREKRNRTPEGTC